MKARMPIIRRVVFKQMKAMRIVTRLTRRREEREARQRAEKHQHPNAPSQLQREGPRVL
jgi:hypothetical protein